MTTIRDIQVLSSTISNTDERPDDYGTLQSDYNEWAPQTPYLFATMYDSRIAPNLSKAINCGLVTLTEVPALASNTFTFGVAQITDGYRMIDYTGSTSDGTTGTTDCTDFHKWAYTLDPPYNSYSFHIASMPISNTTACDSTYNTSAVCVMQNIIRSERPIIQSMESAPGVETKDIWLDVAAIVGGVQFIAWAVQALIDSK